jgi:TetR/AcrR family transcriptional repressor of nem operon
MAGRNPSYNMDEVLEKGIYLFWNKGYNAVTIEDIVKETGINRFSFYEKFGNKDGFFQASLDTYFDVLTKQFLHEMNDQGTAGLKAIRDFFKNMSDIAADPDFPKGCLVINSLMELSQGQFDLQRRFEAVKNAQYEALLNSLKTEKQKGTLKTPKPPESLANYLADEIMSCLATSRVSRDLASRLFGYQLEIIETW